MKKVLEFIKNNKIKITVIVLIIILILIGIVFYFKYTQKKYNLTQVEQYNYFLLNENGKYGVIDKLGKVIIEAKYDSIVIPNPETDVFVCKTEDKNEVVNKENIRLFTEYEDVMAIEINGIVSDLPYEKSVLIYKQNNQYGLINFSGKKITDSIYDEIKGLENKESQLIVKKDDKYGVINSNGATLIENKYDTIKADGFYEEENKYELSGYIVGNKTENGYRYGYISYNLKKVLDVQYNSISRILEANDTKDIYLIVVENGKYGVIKNGKNIIKCSYQNIEYDDDNQLFETQRNTKFGIMTKDGKEIVPPIYDEINIKGIYIEASKDDEKIYFNVNGEKVTEQKYTSKIKAGDEKYIVTDENGCYGIITNTKQLVENKYSYIEYLYDDYFIASNEDGLLGIINSKDSIIIEFKFDVLQKINGSQAIEGKILKTGTSYIYSKNMEEIVTNQKSSIYIEEDYIQIITKDKIIYTDLEGKQKSNKEILPKNKLFAINVDGKWGFSDENQNIVIEAKYDMVTEFDVNGYAGIKVGEKWGVIDENKNIIVDPVYKIESTNIKPEFLGKYYKVYYGYGQSYYTNEIIK